MAEGINYCFSTYFFDRQQDTATLRGACLSHYLCTRNEDTVLYTVDMSKCEIVAVSSHETPRIYAINSSALERASIEMRVSATAVGEAANICTAKHMDILYDTSGAPYTDCGVYVSITHSGDITAIAFADIHIGADIEMIAPRDTSAIARKQLSEAERECADRHGFYRVWTRKEALAKSMHISLWRVLSDSKTFDTCALNAYFRSFSIRMNDSEYEFDVCAYHQDS